MELGLVEPAAGDLVQAKVDLRPYGWDPTEDDDGVSDGGAELWVASDLAAHQRPGVLRHDHVLGIGQASTTLVQVTARRHVARALDLGTGCGIQTFHLLHHAEHVTATDISERALAFTRFNLLLNAAKLHLDPADLDARVSLRLGSLLDPVAGEEFELVVSNPPFVITPRSLGETATDQFTYRDGGLPGDDIVSSLVGALASVLAPGGTAQLLGNWEITAGAGWADRPQSWAGPATDVWFIQREQVGPEQYAETWLQDASESPRPAALPGLVRGLPGRLRLARCGRDRLRHDLAAAACRGRPAGAVALRGDHLPDRAAGRAAPGRRRRTCRLAGRP